MNVGSRLCGQALADQVVAARFVLDRLEGTRDDFDDLGRLELKGVADGMPAVRFSPLSTADERAAGIVRG